MRLVPLCVLLVLLVALRRPALGQPAVESEPPPAAELFRQGLSAYEAHDYQRAQEMLERSHGVDPRPESLFAWAQATRQLGLCAQARALFDRYINADPGPRKIEAARLAMARCTPRALSEAKTPVADEPEAKKETAVSPQDPLVPPVLLASPVPTLKVVASPNEGRRWYQDRWAPTLFAGGAALGVLGWLALNTARARADAAADAANYDDYGTRHDRAVAWDRAGVAALVAGSALFLGGFARYVQLAFSDGATLGSLGLRIKGSF